MDVVLLKEVENLGTQGAVVHVKPGFARNYLLPRGLAVAATAEQIKSVEEIKRQQQRKTQRIKAEAEILKKTIEAHPLSFKLTLGSEEKAFGSVTVHDIVEALSRQGIAVEKHAVHLAQPIKTLGDFEVPIKLHPQVTVNVRLTVVKA